MTRDRHLSEDRLIDFYLQTRADGTADPVRTAVVRAHLTACGPCTRQYTELTGFLDAVHAEGGQAADDHFTDDRLAAQYERVMRRVDHIVHPSQVISFPAARRLPRVDTASGVTRRWVAAAAAACLLVGFAAGRFVDRTPGPAETRVASAAAAATHGTGPTALVAPSALTSADDPFVSLDLSEIDLASEAESPVILQAYDAMTPTVREVSVSPR